MHKHLLIAISAAAGLAMVQGCSTTETADSAAQAGTELTPEQAQRAARRARFNRPPNFGAVDESARRRTGISTDDIFAKLDLPTPDSMRLGSGAPGPGWWQQKTDYVINADVDPEAKRLEATMGVTYHNNSPHQLDFVWLQLEQNLFKPDSLGTLSRTPGSVMSTDLGGFDGGFDIGYIKSGGEELEISVYDTLARVELAEPIAPGATFEFEMAFGFSMPPHLRRMGSEEVEAGTIFEYAQWFPHVAKYDDVNGWNTLPYIGNGEFYTDFGDYEVNVTVPREFIVEGTGVLQNSYDVLTADQIQRLGVAKTSDATVEILKLDEVGTPESRPAGEGDLTWKFTANNVRTFAFATSQAFAWDACKADVTNLDGTTKMVLCQSFYPAEAEAWYSDREYPMADETTKPGGSSQYIKHAIEFYSDWVYPYPYPEMSNINGPEGGMEYPMMVFCGAKTSDQGLFGVTDHEVGHNWYPMLVNSDERRYMWMDEGFNTFINRYSGTAWTGQDGARRGGVGGLARVMNADNPQASNTLPDRHWPRWVGSLNYSKPGYALHLLREIVLGPDRFDTAWKTYTQRWAFKHPQPADFFRSMDDAAGTDLSWFWRGWLLSTATLDQSVTEVIEIAEGQSGITLANLSDMVMPVIMDVTFSDGTTERVQLPVDIWGAANVWRVPIATGERSITRVVLDPDSKYPELTRDNNVWEAPVPVEETEGEMAHAGE
ncbi:MAG: hypothetical protein ACI89L_001818 [Phycisphaerales bacterium]|jgi:hypothetical protein